MVIKSFTVLVVVFVVMCLGQCAIIINDEQKSKLIEYHKECMEESGVDSDILKKLLDGEFPEDDKFKNYLFCVSKKSGFQNDAGEVQKDVVTEKLGDSLKDAEKAKELVAKCAEEKGSASDTVYNVVICLYQSTPTHIILVH